jgi:glycine cleavage system H protein
VLSDDLRYTTEHEWIKLVEGETGTAFRIGITDYAQAALGDIVFVTLPAVGTEVTAGQSLGEVESTKSVSDVYAPVAGRVTASNDQLEGSPDLVNTDPLGAGWMVELVPAGSADQAWQESGWLDAAAYAALTDQA